MIKWTSNHLITNIFSVSHFILINNKYVKWQKENVVQIIVLLWSSSSVRHMTLEKLHHHLLFHRKKRRKIFSFFLYFYFYWNWTDRWNSSLSLSKKIKKEEEETEKNSTPTMICLRFSSDLINVSTDDRISTWFIWRDTFLHEWILIEIELIK